MGRPKENLLGRFWSKVQIGNEQECWPWLAYCNKGGYGNFQYEGKPHLAHSFAYKLTSLDLLHGLFVLHACDNPPCCNPNHLYGGTKSDNEQDKLRRGRNINKNKELCKFGHEYNIANTRVDVNGSRQCKTCDAARARKYRKTKCKAKLG